MNKLEFKNLFDLALAAPAPSLRHAYDLQPLVDKAMLLGNLMGEKDVLVALTPEEVIVIESLRKPPDDKGISKVPTTVAEAVASALST